MSFQIEKNLEKDLAWKWNDTYHDQPVDRVEPEEDNEEHNKKFLPPDHRATNIEDDSIWGSAVALVLTFLFISVHCYHSALWELAALYILGVKGQ